MLGSDSNFIETNDLTMAIVVERDAITFTLILLKECEHPSPPPPSYDLHIHYQALNLYHQRSKTTKQIRLLF
jgi:hypothetical protein